MITVRFADGLCVQYNTANYVNRHEGYSDICTAKDGTWVAQVPNTAIIEVVQACRTYREDYEPINDRLGRVETELRGLKRKLSAALKRLEAK